MGELVRRAIEQLSSAKTLDQFDRCLWIASDLLRKGVDPDFRSGFSDIDREEVTSDDTNQIQSALVDTLGRNSDPRIVSGIISALSSVHDQSLKQLYIDYLSRYLAQLKWSNAVVYAALFALYQLDEDVYEKRPDGSSSQCSADVEKNIRQAERFLQSLGIAIPW